MSAAPTAPGAAFAVGETVRHAAVAGLLTVERVRVYAPESNRTPKYELRGANGTAYDDVEERDILAVKTVLLLAAAPAPVRKRSAIATWDPAAGPGWLYDAKSGQDLGAASYEQRAAFDANGQRPMEMHNIGGCSRAVVVRSRDAHKR